MTSIDVLGLRWEGGSEVYQPHRHEDLSSQSQHSHRKQTRWCAPAVPVLGENTDRSPELLASRPGVMNIPQDHWETLSQEIKVEKQAKKEKIHRCPPYWEGKGRADNRNSSLCAQTITTDIYRNGVWPLQAVHLSPWKAKLKVNK